MIELSKWSNTSNIFSNFQLWKSYKLSFSLNNKIASTPLDKIHCDLWGPAPVDYFQNMKYYVIFVDVIVSLKTEIWIFFHPFEVPKIGEKWVFQNESRYFKVMG